MCAKCQPCKNAFYKKHVVSFGKKIEIRGYGIGIWARGFCLAPGRTRVRIKKVPSIEKKYGDNLWEGGNKGVLEAF